ncbi:two-component regulator propeller domain-containing protein [Flammeovirga agarivorans]|uniref:SpoIIE family protein phosphatase n=1 Tax=Flammeovirga agarivorans TaxID=2726742 RepID=A0A7X8SPR2_9BACT|nr:two-component regulator propeller domain-containing protein [Flammeovirga agarivorans]NLR94116.1 SpoIIE family protein phosphatase [Flammeovirga agarivorans]
MYKYIFIVLLFGYYATSAQQYNITSFNIHDGLSQNYCKVLEKLSNGAILIGTKDSGVNINIGTTFKSFDVSDGLSNNHINDLVVDPQDNIWVATNNGISCVRDREISSYLEDDIESYIIEDITYDNHLETIWGITVNKKVIRLSKYYKKDELKINDRVAYTAIEADEDGHVWIGSKRNGIYIYKGDSLVDKIALKSTINCIEHLSNKRVAVGTNNGVIIFNKRNLKKGAFKILNNIKVSALTEDSDKNLWVGTPYNGVYKTKGIKVLQSISTDNGLSRQIFDIQEDDDGGMWFATNNGLFRYNNDIYTLYSKNFTISTDILKTYQTRDKTTILGSERALHFIKNDKLIRKEILPLNVRHLDIMEDHNNHLYIGTEHGVYEFKNDKWEKLTSNYINKNFHYPSTFFERDKKVFVGALNHIFEIDGDSLIEVTNYEDKLENYQITKVVISPVDSTAWIGTAGKGLFHIDKEWNLIKAFQKRDKSIPSLEINDLVFDQEGNLWIATTDSGLCKISNGLDRAISFQDQKLSITNIRTIQIDKQGNVWAGSNRDINHLIKIDNDIVRVERYGTDEGFNALGYSEGSASRDSEGNLWFGTQDGGVKITPSHHVYSEKTPQIVFENVKVFSEDIPWTDYSEGIAAGSHLPIKAVLPTEYNHLTINFVGVSQNVPKKIKYQWKLVGFDDIFCPPTSSNVAIYPKLPPGDYQFIIRAINAGGIASPDNTEFTFTIDKPFYKKRGVIALILLLIIALSVYVFYSYMKTIRIQKENLQRKVDERTSDILKQREKLETAKNEIEKKSQELTEANERVSDSIKYAATIQNALISCDEQFVHLFPKSFNLSITKSEVTGDFVWMHENDQFIYLLLIDCTNHGVPAALISIVGNQLLEQLIIENPSIKGAELLMKLDTSLKDALKISENTLISDGMDIACCRFEKGTRNLNFSGARRPLIIIEDGELQSIKSNFCSIGIIFNDVTPSFDNFDFELNENAIIYLFSDGFANQFNAAGEKFKKSNFKKLLTEVSHLPLAEQCSKLYQVFHEWKEGVEQDDDMMVVAFKYETNYAESKRDHKIIREVERP